MSCGSIIDVLNSESEIYSSASVIALLTPDSNSSNTSITLNFLPISNAD